MSAGYSCDVSWKHQAAVAECCRACSCCVCLGTSRLQHQAPVLFVACLVFACKAAAAWVCPGLQPGIMSNQRATQRCDNVFGLLCVCPACVDGSCSCAMYQPVAKHCIHQSGVQASFMCGRQPSTCSRCMPCDEPHSPCLSVGAAYEQVCWCVVCLWRYVLACAVLRAQQYVLQSPKL